MHLYLVARAIQDRLNRWENDLLAQYFQYKYKKTDKDPKGDSMVQLMIRPIRIYEVVFPEQCYDEVMQLIHPDSWMAAEPRLKKWLGLVRRILKLKKIPDMKKVTPKDNIEKPFYREHVDVMALGVREDRKNKEGIEQL